MWLFNSKMEKEVAAFAVATAEVKILSHLSLFRDFVFLLRDLSETLNNLLKSDELYIDSVALSHGIHLFKDKLSQGNIT